MGDDERDFGTRAISSVALAAMPEIIVPLACVFD